ncbi:hypothetical protein HYT57_05610 [Candidatus Woesearchaeota archaeon]|nr:hypothetical protein [Candidatus Woesearchaeota archaeon]
MLKEYFGIENKLELAFFVIAILAMTLFSVLNVGYRSPCEDDESSAYMVLSLLKEDHELYKNDYYVQSLTKLPSSYASSLIYSGKCHIPKGDWGKVILFGLESNKDDLFVIPAFSGKYDYSTFRILSRRAVFLEWKGTGEAVYDPSIVPEIRKRFKSYCKVDFLESKDRKDFVETCKSNYLKNTEDDFRFLNINYGADYLIENKQEISRRLNLPIAWENKEFVIYFIGQN